MKWNVKEKQRVLTFKELVGFQSALNMIKASESFAKQDKKTGEMSEANLLPHKIGLRLNVLEEAIEKDVEAYNKEVKKIQEKYKEFEDEDGELSEKDIEKFEKEVKELNDAKKNVKLPEIPYDEDVWSKFSCPYRVLALLNPIMVEKKD